MKTINYKKISEQLNNGTNIPEVINDLIQYTESQYLKYWLTNITLDYITFLEVSDEKINKNIIKQDSDLNKMVKYLKNTISDPTKLLSANNRSRNMKITNLKKYKAMIESRVNVLSAYGEKLKIYEYIFNRLEGKFSTNYADIEDDESFVGNVIQYIFSEQDSVIINDKIKQIYAQLPVRMTKAKYYNIIEQSLDQIKGISQNNLDNYITYIKETFYPEGVTEYGKQSEFICDKMIAFESFNNDNVSESELSEIMTSFGDVADQIENSISYYIFTAHLVNELLGLLFCINEQSLSIQEESINNFKAVMDEITKIKSQDDLLNDNITRLLMKTEGVIEESVFLLGRCDSLIEVAINVYEEEINRQNLMNRYNHNSKMQVLMSGSHFANIDSKEDTLLVDAFYLAKTKNQLIEYMKFVFSKDDRLMQRARIANEFSILNVIHRSPKEVYEFILNALLGCNDNAEKMVSKKLIRQIMQEIDK